MMLDSRAPVIEQVVPAPPLYSASEPSGDVDVWIQPPWGLQVVDSTESTVIDGVYVQTQPAEIVNLFTTARKALGSRKNATFANCPEIAKAF